MKTVTILIIIVILLFLNRMGSKTQINVRYEIVEKVEAEEYASDTHVEEEKTYESLGKNMAKQPAVIKTATVALSEIPNDQEWQIIDQYPYKTVIAQIYKGESSFGKHDVCRTKGMYNGFGYAEPNPLVNGPTCFESFEEVVMHVNNWIQDKVEKGFSLSTMNCYYVRGHAVEECNTNYKLN